MGRLHPHDAERLLRLLGSRKSGEGGVAASSFAAHPAAFPSYSLMFVVALKRELCVQANAPCFQVRFFFVGKGGWNESFGIVKRCFFLEDLQKSCPNIFNSC